MKKFRFLLFLFPFFPASSALAQQWFSHGPLGGVVYDFYRDMGQIWAGTSGGVFFSGDDGRSWTNPAAATSVFNCDSVKELAVSAQDLYVITGNNGIFHSIDGGMNWTASNMGLRPGSVFSDVELAGTIAFIVRADSGVLYRTPDRGASWLRVITIAGNLRVRYLSQHNNVLYATTATGLFMTNDGGITFNLINPAPDLGRMDWTGDTLYVATTAGIRRSIDYGNSFTATGIAGRPLSLVAAGTSYLYSAYSGMPGTPDTVIYSPDGGVSYGKASPFGSARVITITAGSGSTAIAGTDYGIFRSSDGGVSWARSDSAFNATGIRGLAAAGANLYAAAYPMGIFFSADSAASWQHRGSRSAGVIGTIRAVAARNQYAHAGTDSGYFRSINFGNTWSAGATGLPLSGAVSSVTVKSGSGEVIVTMGGTIYYSGNDGAAFTTITGSGLPAGIAANIITADTSYFAIAGGVLYHGNSSLSFNTVTGIAGTPTSVLFMDSLYYAGTAGNGIYVSRNGNTWTTMLYPAPYTGNMRVTALAADSGNLFTGTDNGILRIRPAGLSAVTVVTPEGLDGYSISALALVNDHLFAGTCNNGVWTTRYPAITPPSSSTGVQNAASGTGGLHLYPNPAKNDFAVKYNTQVAGSGMLLVKNMLGAVVLRQPLTLHSGEQTIPVNAATLPAGMYIVQVSAGGDISTARLSVVR